MRKRDSAPGDLIAPCGIFSSAYMKQLLDLFDERYNQSVEFPPAAQPPHWRDWDNTLIESVIVKDTNIPPGLSMGQSFRFTETRDGEGLVHHVGRVTPNGIYMVLRHATGVRAITSQRIMSQAMAATASNPQADLIEYILTNL